MAAAALNELVAGKFKAGMIKVMQCERQGLQPFEVTGSQSISGSRPRAIKELIL